MTVSREKLARSVGGLADQQELVKRGKIGKSRF